MLCIRRFPGLVEEFPKHGWRKIRCVLFPFALHFKVFTKAFFQ